MCSVLRGVRVCCGETAVLWRDLCCAARPSLCGETLAVRRDPCCTARPVSWTAVSLQKPGFDECAGHPRRDADLAATRLSCAGVSAQNRRFSADSASRPRGSSSTSALRTQLLFCAGAFVQDRRLALAGAPQRPRSRRSRETDPCSETRSLRRDPCCAARPVLWTAVSTQRFGLGERAARPRRDAGVAPTRLSCAGASVQNRRLGAARSAPPRHPQRGSTRMVVALEIALVIASVAGPRPYLAV